MTKENSTQFITDEELAELKTLADNATEGEWWIDSHGACMVSFIHKEGDNGETVVIFEPKNYHKQPVRHKDTGNLSHWRNDWDASYISTACPKKIKALIARLEAVENKLKENNIT